MKTHFTATQDQLSIGLPEKHSQHLKFRTRLLLVLGVILSTFFINPLQAQTEAVNKTSNSTQDGIVKGVVSDEDGPLLGVNILLKGTSTGTFSDKNGEFTFPKALKKGDVLVFTFMGYDTKELKIIENLTFLKVELTSDLLEILGALDSEKPYKSKRSN
ncbi:CarboxypepD_reg-like domain-containing protein [Formosa sp. Hel1_31_208]|uniref:carboxypeptidase-like regulatory domain-containing protein n=1 Tax=Formosa sp. Hel1_31_208 TaxID=1798225 RepID=UPI00087A0CE0|nr:carboxypeptidase-like regulatory domain-containing protein [Formosa sp. Hel1_31_208]SDR87285.1 CarboxypepD_reg-like domain-containing protein [Formosa sp. Hel1_31_208]